jgi:iron-sulfur cluster assembly accessory protein
MLATYVTNAPRRNRGELQEGIDMAESKLAESETPLALSESAARRIREIMQSEEAGSMLRISVSGGGCSGFQYGFDVVRAPATDDLVIERDGARVAIDEVSLPFLRGSRLDFVDDLIGRSFRFDNPNATSSCGCGTSFSV